MSKSARYASKFTPSRRLEADAETLLLLHMDGEVGPWAYDAFGRGTHATRTGEPELVEVR